MFKKQRTCRRLGRKVGSICLIGALIVSGGTVSPVQAAAKPSVSTKKVVIPIGKQTKASFTVKNKKKGAKYTYTTSNKKVVKVSKKGVLTGVKNGNAKITVKQVLKKKTTKVGVVQVSVKKAAAVSTKTKTYTYGREKVNVKLQDYVKYINPDATYQLISSNKNIAANVSLSKSKNYTGTISLKNAGNVTFTVKETYQKKSRNICKFQITVKGATFDTKAFLEQCGTMDLDVEAEPLKFIKYATVDDKITMESSNPDVLEVNGDCINTYEEGTAILTIYNGEKVLASVEIKVQYVKITGVKTSASRVDIFMGATMDESISSFEINTVPAGAQLSNCNVKVLNEDICSVNFDPADSNVVEVVGEAEGSTSILITNKEGETLATIPVVVINAMETIISGVKLSAPSIFVDMEGEDTVYTFTTLPNYAYASNCTVSVEDEDICSASLEEDEENHEKGNIIITGNKFGSTKIFIQNQEEKILATIPVTVADTGYTVPKSATVSSTNLSIIEGDAAELTFTVGTNGAKADYCLFQSENEDIATVEVMESEGKTATLEVMGHEIGTTKILVKNFDGETIKTITVKVIEEPEEPDTSSEEA